MFGFAFLLLLLLIVVAVGFAIAKAAGGHKAQPRGPVPGPTGVPGPLPPPVGPPVAPAVAPWLVATVGEWQAAGLLTAEQASEILDYERRRVPAAVPPAVAMPTAAVPTAAVPTAVGVPARRPSAPPVAEALGYLGAALVSCGLVLLLARYWTDLSLGGRLGLSGASALLLLAAGARLRETGPAATRLRAVVWLAASAATAVFAVVAVHDAADVTANETLTLAAAGAVALESGALWRGLHRPAQQLLCLGASVVAVAAAVAHIGAAPGWPGVAATAAGALLILLGLRRLVPDPVLTEGLGALAAVAGGGMAAAATWHGAGLTLLLAVSLALVALSVVPHLAPTHAEQMMFGVVGAAVLLESAPATLTYFAQRAGGATGSLAYAAGAGVCYLGARRLVRVPVAVTAVGGATMFLGAALTFSQWHGVAPVIGALTGVALIAFGTLPGQFVLSLLGSAGLLGNVPWLIGWFFPGQGRMPVLTLVSGALIILIALFLTRSGGRFHSDLGLRHRPRHP